MGNVLSLLGSFGGLVDKVVPIGVGSRTKVFAVLAALLPAVKSQFPDLGPVLDGLQTVAMDLAALFAAAGLVRKNA